jgi:hypothetical protein
MDTVLKGRGRSSPGMQDLPELLDRGLIRIIVRVENRQQFHNSMAYLFSGIRQSKQLDSPCF